MRNLSEYVASADADGKNWTSWFHKTGGPASAGVGRWCDASMGAGIPKYNAYVGGQFAATPLTNQGNDGLFLGPSTPGETKHLHKWMMSTTSTTLHPAHFTLCDYLMHYPLIDGDDTAQQDLDNTQTLPRYTDGAGVRCMIVCTTPMVANATATISYTNQSGVAGRTSTSTLIASSVVGCIISSSNTSASANSVSPFIPLASGDSGIRSIESITLSSGAGGFFAVVLVRPLAHLQIRESATVTEIENFRQRGSMPEVKSGAYLNFIYLPGQSGTLVTLRGCLEFVWR